MQPFTRSDLDRLIESVGGPHVTMVLPPPENPFDTQASVIQMKNLTRQVEEAVTKLRHAASQRQAILDRLQQVAKDERIVGPRSFGVCIYLSADDVWLFRLSRQVEPELVVDQSFYFRPVLPELEHASGFYVLSLTGQRLAFFESAGETLQPIESIEFPEPLDDQFSSVHADGTLQVHSGSRAIRGDSDGIFSGHGGKSDAESDQLPVFIRRTNNALCDYVGERRLLLVLAGSEQLTSLFRRESDYTPIAEASVNGNVDRLSEQELFPEAVKIANEHYQAEKAAVTKAIREQSRQTVTSNPEEILIAAHEGRIDTLLLDRQAKLMGTYDSEKRSLKTTEGEATPGASDLVEVAAIETFRHSGAVHTVDRAEMPGACELMASLRY